MCYVVGLRKQVVRMDEMNKEDNMRIKEQTERNWQII